MKTFTHVLALLVVMSCVTKAFAQDPAKLSPNIYKVILNNDRVRVLDIRIKPGDKSPMHSHPASVVYALSNGTLRFAGPDGKTSDLKIKAGQCLWRDAQKHEPQNVGKTEVHAIQIELKR